jgi:hypothetical protein
MSAKPETANFTPRYPTLIACAVLSVWVVILFLPMFTGHFLGGALSDQTWTGIPFRQFWADEVHRTGHIPLWNPFMFGGLPFVGAMHGDMFYPTSFLRLFLRADQTLNLVFFTHLILAGVFGYAFLRALDVTWTGSLVGGLAYQLSGIVVSLVSPGHDGKMIVSALLPLLLTGLVLGIRKRRQEGYALVALVVGLDILSPQVQMAQYSLIFAGLFSLFLCFRDDERPATPKERWTALGLATVAVALGFGVSMIQILPFVKYGPYAARTVGAQGWEYATSYAMPPANIVDWLTATFTGSSVWGYYWAGMFKLHSEYVGGAVLVLAAVGIGGAATGRRKLAWFLGGCFLLFLLVCLGPATPFYRLWYALVPGVKVTRAPGMAFFIPAFIFACFAAFGVERIERGEGKKVLIGGLIGAGVLLLLGASGALVKVAEDWSGPAYTAVQQIAGTITFGAVASAVAMALAAGLGLATLNGKLRALPLALALAVVVSGDLFINARRSFIWSPSAPVLFAADSVTAHMARTPLPWRAMDMPAGEQGSAYPTAFLMYDRIPNVLGHHGNELHNYDQLLGGKNAWTNVMGRLNLLDLLAVRYIIMPMPLRIPGYHVVTQAARGPVGASQAILYEADTVPPYARVIPAAVKVDDARIVPTLMDPRWDYNRITLLPETASVNLPRVDSIPPPMAARAVVTAWEPGVMTVTLDPAPEHDAYLQVSENWYPDWRASVDGRDAPVMRGQLTLITVPVPRGAKDIQLRFDSPSYHRGKAITLLSLAAILAWFSVPLVRRRLSA